MIYITGDCHGNFRRFAKKQRMKLPFELTGKDYMIVCGDLGLLWAKDGEFEYNLKWLSSLPFTLLWVQGNHENYDMITEYPISIWHGGKTRHIVKDKIILLERGQVFDIDGKSFFTFGGASSHDVQGGILDRNSPTYHHDRKKANESRLPYRVKGVSWWHQELPTKDELQEGRDNLSKAGYKVDFVITHCLSSSMQKYLEDSYTSKNKKERSLEPDILTEYFEELEKKLYYCHWFCGHYHDKLELGQKHTILYDNIVCLYDYF